jgi:hypothetical protein
MVGCRGIPGGSVRDKFTPVQHVCLYDFPLFTQGMNADRIGRCPRSKGPPIGRIPNHNPSFPSQANNLRGPNSILHCFYLTSLSPNGHLILVRAHSLTRSLGAVKKDRDGE